MRALFLKGNCPATPPYRMHTSLLKATGWVFPCDPTLDFNEQYEETLFCGYISDNETGTIILAAPRLEQKTSNILVVPTKGGWNVTC